jgi:small subunit ribosomal protein S20
VAHSISAKKRVRQNLKRRARNRHHKELIKDQIKAFTSAITAGDVMKAEEELKKATQRMDRTAVTGAMHKNTAARKRSRLTKRLNALRAGKGTKAA